MAKLGQPMTKFGQVWANDRQLRPHVETNAVELGQLVGLRENLIECRQEWPSLAMSGPKKPKWIGFGRRWPKLHPKLSESAQQRHQMLVTKLVSSSQKRRLRGAWRAPLRQLWGRVMPSAILGLSKAGVTTPTVRSSCKLRSCAPLPSLRKSTPSGEAPHQPRRPRTARGKWRRRGPTTSYLAKV